jgi:leucyl-tRNA synthetase
MARAYNPKNIEAKWQQRWAREKAFQTPDLPTRPKCYVLDMFPYPSGDGLHVGHVKGYIATDVYARYKMMCGLDVLHPMGWDAFGLPAENYALAQRAHPREAVAKNIDRFKKQLSLIGFSYDWQREVTTTDPRYYRWTQWIFVQLFKAGLAYESDEPINWCPSCKTGLANEDVEDGKCERCGTLVEQRPLRQWVLKIRAYADKLVEGLDSLDWPDSIKTSQRNWIGRSQGSLLKFDVKTEERKAIQQAKCEEAVAVFTTRADTLFGATYVVLAPEHQLVGQLLAAGAVKNAAAVTAYAAESARKTNLMRQEAEREKTGVCLEGVTAVNPATQEEIPVWVADYVLMSYGTGAIMAVPAHDERDFLFAQKFGLPVVCVIDPRPALVAELGDSLADADQKTSDEIEIVHGGRRVYVGPGRLMNSGEFDGMASEEAKRAIVKKIGGEATVMYKMRDWVFSRQRYWGEPIPIIHCETCGAVPVPEEDLPVELPAVEQYEPTGTGESPLASIEKWVRVDCPQCGGAGRRETNTMPQWAGSSWYYLRYVDPNNETQLIALEKERAWLPVNMYVGGAEHATRHLIYARFWHKFLFDQKVVSTSEPFERLQNVGVIAGTDGRKMSKRWGNVVNPDDIIDRFGADTLRVYEMFMGPFNASASWSESSIAGAHRFLTRVWALVAAHRPAGDAPAGGAGLTDGEELLLQQTVERVTTSIEHFRFNTAIAALMELLNVLEKKSSVPEEALATFVRLLAPFAPHLAEELWAHSGQTDLVIRTSWPQINEQVLKSAAVVVPVQVNGKVRGEVTINRDAARAEVEAVARQLKNVAKYLGKGLVKKVVYVEGKMISFVVQ